jgi:O-antigen ligase
MPEHLRALVVILALAALVLWSSQPIVTPSLMQVAEYQRRRNLWLFITATAFASHNFWLYALLGGCAIVWSVSRDRNPPAVYCWILFAIPPFEARIPGFGLLNYIADITHIRLLNILILLPLSFSFLAKASERSAALKLIDCCVGGYLLLMVVVYGSLSSFTNSMRESVYLLIDIWLPYYVFSRSFANIAKMKEAITALVLATLVLAVIAVFEIARGWLLYSSLDETMGASWGFGSYLARGVGGPLRSSGSTGHPIVLGYLMVVALALALCLDRDIRPRRAWWLCVAGLVAGLAASVSRGPWVGALAALLVGVCVGKGGQRRLLWFGSIGAGVVSILLVSPVGAEMLRYVPFVGDVDSFNVTYRERLIEVSLSVLWQSPLLGVPNVLAHPAMQEMVQGEGIIDIVNTYLGVALGTGLLGLSLFVGAFLAVIYKLLRHVNATRVDSHDFGPVCRCLLGAIAGTMVTIATTSSVSTIGPLYWVLLGLGAAFIRLADGVQEGTKQMRVRPDRSRNSSAAHNSAT